MSVDFPTALVLVHAASTLALLGLIWFVQVVHYPLFEAVGREGFARYAITHQTRTGWVVVPPMLLELASAVALVVMPPAGIPPALAWAGLLLLGTIWISTGLLQVPRHGELAHGFDPRAHARLVRSNWIRTAAWSLRGVLALWMLALAGARP